MRQPQEFPDEEYEQIVERVAAIDVAKASGTVCTRVPHESEAGKRVTPELAPAVGVCSAMMRRGGPGLSSPVACSACPGHTGALLR